MAQLMVSWFICDGRFRVHAINPVGRRRGRIIEIEDVDSGLAEDAQPASGGVLRDQLLHGGQREVPHRRNAMRLELRVRGRDLRVEGEAWGRRWR